jgi:hypothetical protein
MEDEVIRGNPPLLIILSSMTIDPRSRKENRVKVISLC